MLFAVWQKRCLMALLLFSLVAAAGGGNTGSKVFAEDEVGTTAFGTIYLDQVSFVGASDMYIFPSNAANASVSFTLTVHNGGSDEIDFNEYWVRLLTDSGSSYMVQMLPQDKNNTRIGAGTNRTFTFYSQVSSTLKANNLIIRVFKWDFSQENYERVLGDMHAADSGYSAAAPYGDKKLFQISGVAAEALVSRVLLNNNDKNTLVTVYAKLFNKGSISFDIPSFRYYIRTAEGPLYPAELGKSGKQAPIHPGEFKEIQLTATIPAEYDISTGGELFFAQSIPVTGQQVSEANIVPIAAFGLVPKTKGDETERAPVDFSTRDGIYTAGLHTIQRLPWEDKDLISVDLSIRNNGSRSLPIPKLTGYFMLDDKVKIETVIVQSDDLSSVAGNSDIHFQAIGKVAYQSSITKLKFVLQELDEDKAINDLAEFTREAASSGISNFTKQYVLSIDQIGRRAEYSIKDVSTYTSETSELFISNVEMENKEERYVNAPNLTAFLRDSSGTIFSTSISVPSKRIIPGGKALLSVEATVPKGMSKKGLQLLIGQSVKGDKVASIGEQADAFYDVVALEVPQTEREAQHILKKIDLFPYQLSLSAFTTRANLLTGDLSVSFHTELSKDAFIETSTKGHSLYVEIKDEKTDVSFSDHIELENMDSTTTQDSNHLIKLGNGKYTVQTRDEEFITHVSFSGKYQLSIYDDYKGHRRLITSKPVSWFASLD
ncbi:hypothetical protein GC097_09920 [Paenibacillus sp. LMG 31457]|uniref:Uncharacterized protein n=1 Tax=Paenibacillus planticolens TaxID=2654976 RepID=A0ABX1ZJU9_9BACL|nr:hypothetical protein [Paenibacillus planticolens]